MKSNSSICHRTGNYAKRVLAAVVHPFKVRYTAKPFNIWKQEVCKIGENESYWLGYDGKIYFGHRWIVFIDSAQNDWWLSRNSR